MFTSFTRLVPPICVYNSLLFIENLYKLIFKHQRKHATRARSIFIPCLSLNFRRRSVYFFKRQRYRRALKDRMVHTLDRWVEAIFLCQIFASEFTFFFFFFFFFLYDLGVHINSYLTFFFFIKLITELCVPSSPVQDEQRINVNNLFKSLFY